MRVYLMTSPGPFRLPFIIWPEQTQSLARWESVKVIADHHGRWLFSAMGSLESTRLFLLPISLLHFPIKKYIFKRATENGQHSKTIHMVDDRNFFPILTHSNVCYALACPLKAASVSWHLYYIASLMLLTVSTTTTAAAISMLSAMQSYRSRLFSWHNLYF